MKNWYCKPASEAEAIEIVERAVANGAVRDEFVGELKWDDCDSWGVIDGRTHTGGIGHAGQSFYGKTQYTIDELRQKFPLPGERVESAEWNGEGLPPAGTVCEVLCPDDEWHKTFIIGTDDAGDTVFTAHEFPDFYKYGGTSDAAAFRPIRTEREVWVEAANKAYSETLVGVGYKDAFGAIYDALKSGALKAPVFEG